MEEEREGRVKEIMRKMERELEMCPRCETKQPLMEAWIQKKIFGGKFSKDNTTKICAACNQDYTELLKDKGLEGHSFEEFKQIYQAFLKTEVVEEMSTSHRALQILRELAGLRVRIGIEEQRYAGRFRSRSKRLDEVFPLAQSDKLRGFGYDSWQKLLMSQIAEVKDLKKILEREIAGQIQYFSIWDMYLKHIPGIGPWLAGFLIGAIQDPRRFPSTSNLTGYAGLRVENGVAQAKTREKLDYSPLLKIAVVQLIPNSLQYQKSRFPDSPYSQLLASVKDKEQKKAERANPTKCGIRNCDETEIVNLGYDEEGIFQGYCCKKTLDSKKPHKFLHPGHIQRRVLREVGKKFLSDSYHAWLYLLGENPDITMNSRIMWVFDMATREHLRTPKKRIAR